MKQKPTFNRWLTSLSNWVGRNICNPRVLKTIFLVFKLLITTLRFIERVRNGVLWFFYKQPSPFLRITERQWAL